MRKRFVAAAVSCLLLGVAFIQARAQTTAPPAFSAAHPLSIVHRLAQRPPTRTSFAEAHFSSLLDRALVLHGELAWRGGNVLERTVSEPYSEHTKIDGSQVSVTRGGHGTRHFSLDRAPAMKALLDGLIAVLGGDPERLRGVFDATLQGRPQAYWSLVLVPRSARLEDQLQQLVLDGKAGTLRCIEIRESDTDMSIYVLGTLAGQVPSRPTRAALQKLCRAG